jgi:RNA polymerase sigma-70 factor (ECF subfamily)
VAARPRLFAIAYRMLGSAHDAEDAVQESFLRWQRLAPDERAGIANPDAWLTTVVSRICLDQLGSARARREQYTGVWLPEPVPGRLDDAGRPDPATDPADVITLEESVSLAMLVVMEQLSPAERVSFILHDLFGVPFAQIADAVGRSEPACRQLAASARRHLRGQRRYDGDGPERDRVVQAFRLACESGDLDGLLAVLDPRVTLRSDGGGRISAATRPVVGGEAVARFLLGILFGAPAPSWTERYGSATPRLEIRPVNGQTGIVVHLGDQPALVAALAVTGDRVAAVDLVVNPDKLTAWRTDRTLDG